ncbi:hypothetical protein EVAR_32166_1 [Eumeta japonica]|uniref:Uncharacterized protein n=1 Tax=Eumeta variegata TaxID=151549 RepID=A0A4C1VYB7_EUMVA|nr:hypothetical protein EVAR_32166_1 [Eumeta japonica]
MIPISACVRSDGFCANEAFDGVGPGPRAHSFRQEGCGDPNVDRTHVSPISKHMPPPGGPSSHRWLFAGAICSRLDHPGAVFARRRMQTCYRDQGAPRSGPGQLALLRNIALVIEVQTGTFSVTCDLSDY